jgi:hypothetical protein
MFSIVFTFNRFVCIIRNMTITELKQHATLYQVARILKISPPAVYKWEKKEQIPPLRLYQLKELRPEWFLPKKN